MKSEKKNGTNSAWTDSRFKTRKACTKLRFPTEISKTPKSCLMSSHPLTNKEHDKEEELMCHFLHHTLIPERIWYQVISCTTKISKNQQNSPSHTQCYSLNYISKATSRCVNQIMALLHTKLITKDDPLPHQSNITTSLTMLSWKWLFPTPKPPNCKENKLYYDP